MDGFLARFRAIQGVTFVLEEVSDGEKAGWAGKLVCKPGNWPLAALILCKEMKGVPLFLNGIAIVAGFHAIVGCDTVDRLSIM